MYQRLSFSRAREIVIPTIEASPPRGQLQKRTGVYALGHGTIQSVAKKIRNRSRTLSAEV